MDGFAFLPLGMVKQHQRVYLLQCIVRSFRFYEEQKLLIKINKHQLPKQYGFLDFSKSCENIIDTFNQDSEYIIANMNEISLLPEYIEKFIERTDKLGNKIIEIILKK
ncbi:MAG: hypothetical protein LBP34_03020 [Flavobacteriaceae bacterium]|jgi:hypothetical protein|nr:hypothetical protein [Flavobacteriaceae bacterium]